MGAIGLWCSADRVRGLVVMIVACQVMDPGSIPGERIFVLIRDGLTTCSRVSFIKKNNDLRGNRTPNLRVWNPTRCHCAMKSFHARRKYLGALESAKVQRAVLAERLRRTLKARVRKSVGSIPTDCISFLFFFLSRADSLHESLDLCRNRWQVASCHLKVWLLRLVPVFPGIAQLAERETVDGYN